jgi:hypothetical protein
MYCTLSIMYVDFNPQIYGKKMPHQHIIFHIKINGTFLQHAIVTVCIFVLPLLLPHQFHNKNLFNKH